MATDFTQDAVLHFLQSNGGRVKNADLLQHFNYFIRTHADRDRNRDLFKKFINSVAKVTLINGVSHVVLRNKYQGYVPGTGTGQPAGRPQTPTWNMSDSSPVNANRNPAGGSDKHRDKPPRREEAARAPSEAARAPSAEAHTKTILPAAGVITTGSEPGPAHMVGLRSPYEPTSRSEPGPAHMVGQKSPFEPISRSEPGPAHMVGLRSPYEPISRSEPVPAQTVGQRSPYDPTSRSEPGPAHMVGQKSPYEPIRRSEPGPAHMVGQRSPYEPISRSEPVPAQTVDQRSPYEPISRSEPGPAQTVDQRSPYEPISRSEPVPAQTVDQRSPYEPISRSEPGPAQTVDQRSPYEPISRSEPGPAHMVGQKSPYEPIRRSEPGPAQTVDQRSPYEPISRSEPVPAQTVDQRSPYEPISRSEPGPAQMVGRRSPHEPISRSEPGPAQMVGLRSPYEPIRTSEPVPAQMAVQRSPHEPISRSEPGPAQMVGRRSPHEPISRSEPGPAQMVGRRSPHEPIRRSEPGPAQMVGQRSPHEPIRRSEPGPAQMVGLRSPHEPIRRSEPGPAQMVGWRSPHEPISRSEPGPAQMVGRRSPHEPIRRSEPGPAQMVGQRSPHEPIRRSEPGPAQMVGQRSPHEPIRRSEPGPAQMVDQRSPHEPIRRSEPGPAQMVGQRSPHELIRRSEPGPAQMVGQWHPHEPTSGSEPVPAQMVGQMPKKKRQKVPSLSQLPNQQQSLGSGPPPGPSQQVPEPVRSERSLMAGDHPQLVSRRFRNRKSYKSAVSEDNDDEEDEEVSTRQCSAGGVWSPNGRPSSSSSSSSAEKKLPQIFIQSLEGQMKGPGGPLEGKQRAGPGLKAGCVPEEMMSRRSQASEHQPPKSEPNRSASQIRRYEQPAGAPLEPQPSPALSSSHSSIVTSSSEDVSIRDTSPSGPSGWSSSCEGLQTRGEPEAMSKTQESVPYPANMKTSIPRHHSMGNIYDEQRPTAHLSARHPSSDQLNDSQQFPTTGMRWHVSTGDLHDDHKDAESSEDSISSNHTWEDPTVSRRISSRLKTRMCHSLEAELDQQEGSRIEGNNKSARLDRIQLISSSLSLRYNLSSSSLSSCATPPRCPSPVPSAPVVEKDNGRRRSNPPGHHGGQSLPPLEPREHAWMVKAAAGAWTDIYSLFREDSSLLNRQDFISGFSVLHWIAQHGDHRVLNTLCYGAEKVGVTFNINSKSRSGQTPLHVAAIHGNKNIIRMLVKKFRADVWVRDMAGRRPWQYLSLPSLESLELLRAPLKAAVTGQGRVRMVDSGPKPPQQQRRRHFSTASSGKKPFITANMTKVKRSTSFAALLKNKSLQRFYGNRSGSPV